MGGATFEYPGRSCVQETDSPTHCGQTHRGWRRVTAGALSYAQGGSRRQTARPTTQGTSKPYPFSGAQGASAPRKGCSVTQSKASTNGACPRTKRLRERVKHDRAGARARRYAQIDTNTTAPRACLIVLVTALAWSRGKGRVPAFSWYLSTEL